MKYKISIGSNYLLPALHVLLWTLLILSPYLFGFPGPENRVNINTEYRLFLNNSIIIVLFYLNANFIYPVFYKKRGVFIYILVALASIALLVLFSSYIEDIFLPARRRGGSFPAFLTYLVVVSISFSYRIVLDSAKQEKIRKEKENENLKTELSFLRSQISPHFIFNILNNLVSLARKKSDLLEPSLLRLSTLMRYMLYENDERISLEREIDYLKSYIDLQLLRFGDDITVDLQLASDINEYEIEPMLLIPFVENAFKHGVGMIEHPVIKIFLSVDPTTHWLDFKVENNIAPAGNAKDKSSGIGLNNVKRRLELLYRSNHQLKISQIESIFMVVLKIKLK